MPEVTADIVHVNIWPEAIPIITALGRYGKVIAQSICGQLCLRNKVKGFCFVLLLSYALFYLRFAWRGRILVW